MVVEIIRQWTDKRKKYQYGQDKEGRLYCKEIQTNVTLVCVDSCFKRKGGYYYRFINPETKKVHMVRRQ